METKRVMVSGMVAHSVEGSHCQKYFPKQRGEAVFHGFGVDYEQLEHGCGNFTTAIVEWPDGQLEGVSISLVKFLN